MSCIHWIGVFGWFTSCKERPTYWFFFINIKSYAHTPIFEKHRLGRTSYISKFSAIESVWLHFGHRLGHQSEQWDHQKSSHHWKHISYVQPKILGMRYIDHIWFHHDMKILFWKCYKTIITWSFQSARRSGDLVRYWRSARWSSLVRLLSLPCLAQWNCPLQALSNRMAWISANTKKYWIFMVKW